MKNLFVKLIAMFYLFTTSLYGFAATHHNDTKHQHAATQDQNEKATVDHCDCCDNTDCNGCEDCENCNCCNNDGDCTCCCCEQCNCCENCENCNSCDNCEDGTCEHNCCVKDIDNEVKEAQ